MTDSRAALPCRRKKVAFTLAEVLITLGIIGVVAAITIPTLIQNVAERSNSEKEANTVQKINKSMDLMRADGKLMVQYESTDKFVDELVKYLRVTTRCDAAHIANCWPTAKVITSDGEEYEVKNAKTGKNLNLKDNTTNNVGLILNDGTPLIVTYNQSASLISDGDTVQPNKKSLPIGYGKTKEYVYGSSVMNSIDFVMDVNGFRGPNSETRNGKLYDIRSYSVARFSKGASCPTGEISVGLATYCNLVTSYSPVDCSSNGAGTSDYTKYCGTPSGYSNDYWAGARKACDQIGMTLPDKTKLREIRATAVANTSSGLPTTGGFWSSTEYGNQSAYRVTFNDGETYGSRKNFNLAALCIE